MTGRPHRSEHLLPARPRDHGPLAFPGITATGRHFPVGFLPAGPITRVRAARPVAPPGRGVMASTLPPPADRWYPMSLTDQRGATAFAWFPPGTATDPAHVLPARVYGELCRLA